MRPTRVGELSLYGIRWPGASGHWKRGGLAHKRAGVALAVHKAILALDLKRVSVLFATDNVVTAAAISRQGDQRVGRYSEDCTFVIREGLGTRKITEGFEDSGQNLNVVADALSRSGSCPWANSSSW